MPYREIIDDGGVWIVFSTQPRSGANVRPQYASGWLSFHRGVERRRLSPIPSGWEDAGDDQLRVWLRSSELVAKAAEDAEALTDAGSPGSVPAKASAGTAANDPGAGTIPETAEPGPATARAAAPMKGLQKSVERIREMLSSIRGDIT